MLILGTPI